MYKIYLKINLFSTYNNKFIYDLTEIENDLQTKAVDEGKFFFFEGPHYFILNEEQTMYFKLKYENIIRKIEEIKNE